MVRDIPKRTRSLAPSRQAADAAGTDRSKETTPRAATADRTRRPGATSASGASSSSSTRPPAATGKEITSVSPTENRKDPYKKFNFLVQIEGIAEAGFMECTGLETETEVIEYREGGDANVVRLLPGLTIQTPLVLSRGVTDSKSLYNWRKSVVDGLPSRKDGSVILLDDKRKEIARWKFVQGWPSRMSGPDLDAMDSDVAIEEIEISHEGIERA
jgi:phage tail-like protein